MFEAGKPMIDLRTGDWAALGRDAATVRQQVLVRGRGIPAAMEWDEADAGPSFDEAGIAHIEIARALRAPADPPERGVQA